MSLINPMAWFATSSSSTEPNADLVHLDALKVSYQLN